MQKKLRAALGGEGDAQQRNETFAEYASRLDRAAKRGVIHPNAAARRKSRANRALVAAK